MIPLSPVFEQLLAVLERMNIPFLVGGSVASGVYGVPRQTNDIDIVADFQNVDMAAFCDALSGEFYVDPATSTDALKHGRPFNAIHLKGAFKFDFFPASSEGFPQSELARRRYIVSALPGLENLAFPVSSPEDTILAKLVWFRQGGAVSDRQWHDILGILRVQQTRLDEAYLQTWAERLSVADLLKSAIKESSANI